MAVFANQQGQPARMLVIVILAAGVAGLLVYSLAGARLRNHRIPSGDFRALDGIAGGLLCLVGSWFVLQLLLK